VLYSALQQLLPRAALRYVKHFEAVIEDAVRDFAASLAKQARVLDAGAGEGQYKHLFSAQRYTGFDLAVGDPSWDYTRLDALGDLESLPFADATFAAALSVVTLEHVKHPQQVVSEMARILQPGGQLLLIVPHQWEEHQQPHDFFRYTRYGVRLLTETAGLQVVKLDPVGGIFRLLSRRLLGAISALPFPLDVLYLLWALFPALLLPLLDGFDREKDSTLGFVCIARKPA
jgi:SAM-dependent methyltransferase